MHRVLVLGAGKIGALVAGLLGESGDYLVHLADKDFLANRFGRFYDHGGNNQISARLVATGEAGHQRAVGE